jgi:hypothetical protein
MIINSAARPVDGEWRDDDMNGHGVMMLPNGERYEG